MEGVQSFQKRRNKIPYLGIDLLGGDSPSLDHLLETLQSLYVEIHAPFRLVIFSTPEMLAPLEAFRQGNDIAPTAFEVILCHEVIRMEDEPLTAIRKKKDSSLRMSLKFLNEGKIDALISNGNTGALVTGATVFLKTLPGISRPALITLLPTRKKPVAVIDVGANIQCSPETLVNFAQMGVAYQKALGIPYPKVGLLNIGSEEIKGRSEHRQTYQLLQEFDDENATFVGNVEGKEVFFGEIDVLVTDGFTGNIFLKTAEGLSAFILDTMKRNKNLLPFSKPLLTHLENELNAAEHPGAILCGVQGIIVKCHGDANEETITSGVQGALNLLSGNFLEKMKEELSL